jgi:hypothetical protein
MHSKVKYRLARIEKALPKPVPARAESPAPLIAARLAAMGVERLPTESLAETWARALGISCGQLRAQLERGSAGLN